MIYVFSVKVRVGYELDDILHSTYDVSSVVEYFESIGKSAKNIKSHIDGFGYYMTPDLCIVNSDFDISELTKLQGALAIFMKKDLKK